MAARVGLVTVLLSGIFFGGLVKPASAAAGDVVRVSLTDDDTQANGFSDWPTMSTDGRYVAFNSDASNLVPGDTNNVADAFVRDTQTGVTKRISVSTSGVQGNAPSHDTVISADGRYVSFLSLATNLTPHADTVNSYDIFLHDLQTGTTSAVSIAMDNKLGTSGRNAYHQTLSADGRYVAFNTSRGNIVPGDTNLTSDIFVRDMQAGITTRVSVGPNNLQSNGDSFYTNMSLDGRYIAFHSSASNLVAGDTNGKIDAFVYDRQSGTTTRVSLASGGVQSQNGDSLYPSISADGRFVAIRSLANNLVPGDTNSVWDIFVHDRQTGVTSLASAPVAGGFANGDSFKPSISGDGRYVAFDSIATNLVSGDTNAGRDIFLRDMTAGTTVRVSVSSSGAQGVGGDALYPTVSLNSQYIAFSSYANNLVAGDTNNTADIFIYEQAVGSQPATNTPTSTATSTATFTPTYTATSTATSTATFTPTYTATLTATSTITNTPTFTSTASFTPTLTFTPTFTVTAEDTATFTATPSSTFVPEETATPTQTMVETPTSTAENPTPTFTATATASLTSGSDETATPTQTMVETPSSTATAENTATFTATATPSFTATAENTATFTPTLTPTSTITPTATPFTTFPTTSILDGFNRSNGALGGNWSGSNVSALTVSSNQLSVNSPGESYAYWHGTFQGADQEAYFTFVQVYPNSSQQGLLLKLRSSGLIKVVYNAATNVVQVVTYHSTQGWVQRGADIPVVFGNGDQFGARARADGTVEVYKNGTLLASRAVTAWPSYADGGYIGIGFSSVTGATIDNFGGGTR